MHTLKASACEFLWASNQVHIIPLIAPLGNGLQRAYLVGQHCT